MSYGGGEREEDRALGYKQSVMEQQRGEAGTPPRAGEKEEQRGVPLPGQGRLTPLRWQCPQGGRKAPVSCVCLVMHLVALPLVSAPRSPGRLGGWG